MQDLCVCFISTVQSTIGYISDVLLSLSIFDFSRNARYFSVVLFLYF
jgi:hypothetical protein